MILKPLAILAAALSFAVASPTASAWYAYNPQITVTDINGQQGGQWTYQYTVNNQTTCFGNCADTVGGYSIENYLLGVNTFAIPYFSDAFIDNINTPQGWSFHILGEDTFNLGFGAGTLEWFAVDPNAFIAKDASLGGFSYTTVFAPGKGPFSATLGNATGFIGDPAIPLSPNAILAGITQPNAVPEPATGLLLLAAMGALAARRRTGARAG